MDVTEFPTPPPEFSSQKDKREYVHMACEGQPPERRKKLILEARAVGLLDEQDVSIFLNAHGVSNA